MPEVRQGRQTESWLLGIDAAGAIGGVALRQLLQPQAGHTFSRQLAGRTFSAELVPAISDLLLEAQIRLADVDTVAVVNGPGAFTGIRVGLSVAKGLVEPFGTSLIAISRLAVCASVSGVSGDVLVALDAGRGEFYFGDYRDQGMLCIREALLKADDVEDWLRPGAPVVTFEHGVSETLAAFGPHRVEMPGPPDLLNLAAKYREGARFSDPLTLDANYLRKSDAELFSRPKLEQDRRPL